MKKLFLFIITVCMTMDTFLYGMEESTEQAAFRVFIENACANTQLVRPIAHEWVRQHPNDTYEDFLAEYNGKLPVSFMRAVWREIRNLQVPNLLRRNMPLIIEAAHNATTWPHVMGFINNPPKGIDGSISGHGFTGRYKTSSRSNEIWFGSMHDFAAFDKLMHIKSFFDNTLIDKLWDKTKSYLGWQKESPSLLGLHVRLPDRQYRQRGLFNACFNSLLRYTNNFHREGWLIIIMFIDCEDNMMHFMVAHRGAIAVIPSIVIPGGEAFLSGPNSAPDGVVQQIVQTAIVQAVEQQPGNLHTIDDAFQYLTENF